jgi:hypothetical protein
MKNPTRFAVAALALAPIVGFAQTPALSARIPITCRVTAVGHS